jgi:leader peptidase (prepilin peptidase)/N-methyltransferase
MLGLAPNPLDWLIASAAYPWLALVLGLCVGSFLNVVIHRLPLMMEREWTAQCAELRGEVAPDHAPLNLSQPRSRCPACGQAISALQNIPLLSFLWLRGRCAACSTRISWRYPLVELFCGLATAYCALHFGFSFAAAAAMLSLPPTLPFHSLIPVPLPVIDHTRHLIMSVSKQKMMKTS